MKKSALKTAFFALSALALVGCSTPNLVSYDPVSFDGEKQYYVNVRTITVDKSQTLKNLPNLPFSIYDSINSWVSYKLQANGTTGSATLNVEQADLEFVAAKDEGSFFSRKPSGKITAKIVVNITGEIPNSNTDSVSVIVQGDKETPHNMTIEERDEIAYDLMVKVIRKMDEELQINMAKRPKMFTVK